MKRKSLPLIGCVVAAHLFFFFFNFKGEKKAPPPKKSIVVHTYAPSPPPPPRPKPQKKVVKALSQPPKPAVSSAKKEILNELKESLAKIQPSPPPETTLSIPKEIRSLQVDREKEEKKSDYFICLAHALKEGLELPELGDVKLELTINQTGKVLKVCVLHADSEKNRRYLELNLPQMKLPPFSEDLKNAHQHTFRLTFCNAS